MMTTWPCGRRRAGFQLAVAQICLSITSVAGRSRAMVLTLRSCLRRTHGSSRTNGGKLFRTGAVAALRAWSGSNGIVENQATGLGLQEESRTIRAIDGDGPDVRGNPDLREAGGRARVSLTMIVRDEQVNLPRALESVRGVFDEIVVVDTGSRDRTVEIAESFGARVFHFAWIDDFAAARNAASHTPQGIMLSGLMRMI